jgi:hypothetical protein
MRAWASPNDDTVPVVITILHVALPFDLGYRSVAESLAPHYRTCSYRPDVADARGRGPLLVASDQLAGYRFSHRWLPGRSSEFTSGARPSLRSCDPPRALRPHRKRKQPPDPPRL